MQKWWPHGWLWQLWRWYLGRTWCGISFRGKRAFKVANLHRIILLISWILLKIQTAINERFDQFDNWCVCKVVMITAFTATSKVDSHVLGFSNVQQHYFWRNSLPKLVVCYLNPFQTGFDSSVRFLTSQMELSLLKETCSWQCLLRWIWKPQKFPTPKTIPNPDLSWCSRLSLAQRSRHAPCLGGACQR